jgi:hypothetical protein
MKATPGLLVALLVRILQLIGAQRVGKTVVAVWSVAKTPPTERLTSLFWAKT